MNRIDRLTAILIQLQTKKVVKAREIADRFNISLRTVYRDVKALEEAGVPVGAEAGLGYFLMEGYHLPPVMFSKEEAAALLTGEKLLQKMADKSVGNYFSAAMQKIRAVLRVKEKEYLESLDKGIVVAKFTPKAPDQFPNHFLAAIQQGVAERKVLEMEYFSSYKDEVSRRQVEPVRVCYLGNSWHMIAWCRLRNAIRNFALTASKPCRCFRSRSTSGRKIFCSNTSTGLCSPAACRKWWYVLRKPASLHGRAKVLLRADRRRAGGRKCADDLPVRFGHPLRPVAPAVG